MSRDDYESVPYPGKPYPQSHPDRLATIGTLFGMQPADVNCCRILELGCGDGLNLIGIALVLPGSELLGIDLSRTHIAAGLDMVTQLNQPNIRLLACDIREDLTSLGRFDYIIAHGLYSWVPPPVQERLLAICQSCLTPQGIAFVSYNTYPGGHLRMMLREMMLYHVQGIRDPSQQTQQATALLQFLQASSDTEDPYRLLAKHELGRVLKFPSAHLLHDDLAEYNIPVYFHEFVHRARGHGLQFLSEAEFHDTQDLQFPPHVADALRAMEADPVAREQYIDFIRCRRFRQSLLCRMEVSLHRPPAPHRITRLRIAGQLKPSANDSAGLTERRFRFEDAGGSSLETASPLLSAALTLLGRHWPQSVPFFELSAQAGTAVEGCYQDGTEAAEDYRALPELLLRLYAANLIELRTVEPPYATVLPRKPTASPLARLQLRSGSSVVTNLRHYSVSIEDPFARHLLGLLDGSRNRDALAAALLLSAQAGEITLEQGRAEGDTPESRLNNHLETCLSHLARCCLLMKEP